MNNTLVKCTNCGSANQQDSRFCVNCGSPLSAPEARGSRLPELVLVIGAGLLLISLAVVGMKLAGFGPFAAAAALDGTPGTPAQQAEVRSVIAASNQAQIVAFRTLNAGVMQNMATGQALETFNSEIDKLKSHNAYEVAELLSIDYVEYAFPDADHAKVRTHETWRAGLYSNNGRQSGSATQDNNEVYSLVRSSGQWLIERIDITHN